MKQLYTFLVIFLVVPFALLAQSVTTGALGMDTLCTGSTITVNYTASGSFGAKNVFTVQLSAPDGSFSPSFQNVGQLKSTTSGSITVTLNVAPGTRYRLRVASSNPYIIGNDNGSDITIGAIPHVMVNFDGNYNIFLLGDSIRFFPENAAFDPPIDLSTSSYFWNFDSGASPATSTDSAVSVTYNTTGTKAITLATMSSLGCSGNNSDSISHVQIYSCNPAIPSDAYIDSVDASTDNGSMFPSPHDIWVVPGGILNAAPYIGRTIFAEAGASVLNTQQSSVLYLKDGATTTNSYGIIIHSPGAGLNGTSWAWTLTCNSLAFDYSNAPPYKIIPAAVGQNQSGPKINIYPNPASNLVTIASPEIPSSISVRNELGEEVLSDHGPIVTNRMEFDVSKFATGVYYADLDFGNRKETIKFTVAR